MTNNEITDLLFIREEPIAADLAMVFGAANEIDLGRRTHRGVQLYQDRFVPRLLVTGGGVLARSCPEVKRMADIASEAGVPDHDLLVEDRSASTFENARFSATLLDAHGLLDDLSTVLLVSSEWHMRRVLLTTKKYFPANIRFVCCPTCEGCNGDDWKQSDACRMEVLNEATLLEAFLMTGAI